MRKTLAIIVAILLSLPAFSQKTIREGMQQIKDKYDVTFIYDSGIDLDRPYQGEELKGKSLRRDLNILFNGSDIEASVKKGQVVLKQRPARRAAGEAVSALSEVQLLDSSKIVDKERPLLSYLTPRAMGISDIAVTDATELLKGRAPGVSVISSPASLGTLPTMYIRGLATTADARPLYVVDGARVYSLEGIAPDDIESVEAVRDAGVLTLFGPDAADGVVIIKTKKGTARGLHIGYTPQLLFQSPAWAPESITLDEINAMTGDNYSADEYKMYSMEEGTHTSISKNHHVSVQYGSSKLSVYAGASFLDHDGPMKGDEWYKRNAGTWSIQFTPAQWLSFTTSGNLAKTDLKTDQQYTWRNLIGLTVPKKIDEENSWDITGRRFASFLNAAAALEVRPFKGFSVKADAGYSNTYEKAADTDWPKAQTKMDYSGRENAWKKWHAGAQASYSAELFQAHTIDASFLYRHRVEDNSLLSASSEMTVPVEGVEWADAAGILDKYFFPEVWTWLQTPEEWGHLNWVYPVMWTWKRDQMAARLGYDYKGRYSIKAAYMHQNGQTEKPAEGLLDGAVEPYDSWSVTASLNLTDEPLVRRYIPGWWKTGALRFSIGGTDMDCLNSNTIYPISRYNADGSIYVASQEDISRSASQDYYMIKKGYSRREEAGLDLVFSAAGELGVSATAFRNNDHTFIKSPLSIYAQPFGYNLLNYGLELSLGWKGTRGALRYSVAGNLTLMNNKVTFDDAKTVGLKYKNDLMITEGYPVGVSHLCAFSADNYLYTEYEGKTYVQYYDADPQYSYYGGVMPTTCYGLQGMIGWKMLTLSVSGHGMAGNTIMASVKGNSLWRYYYENYPTSWNGIMSTTAFLLDGSFFRIDQLRLDCAIPTGRLPFKASVFASLENFFLFTDYPGNDPEMALMSDSFGMETCNYPTSKRILTGLRFEF